MRRILNLKSISLMLYLAVILGIAYSAYSRSSGITGRTKKGNTPGCTCHGDNPTAGVNIQWIGPDTVTAGQSANYSIVITGGPLLRAGTNIAARNGSLSIVDNFLKVIGGELTHTGPKPPSGGNVTFSFRYTAPNFPLSDTVFANGNSVNNSGDEDGDSWNYASNKRVVVRTATGIVMNSGTAVDFALAQNFPNPFNPETSISFSVTGTKHAKLEVTDITGRTVATLVNEVLPAGIYSAKLNASNLPSGIYFYSLVSGTNRDIKKMTVIK